MSRSITSPCFLTPLPGFSQLCLSCPCAIVSVAVAANRCWQHLSVQLELRVWPCSYWHGGLLSDRLSGSLSSIFFLYQIGLHFFTVLTFTACWLCTSSKEGSPISAMVFADTVLVAVCIQGSNLRIKTVWPMARKSSENIHHEDLPISEQLDLCPRSQVSMLWWRTTRCSNHGTACLFGNCPSWSVPDTVRHVRWQSIGMKIRD